MAYDLYPAVDPEYNFPPEVRNALARANELRNQVVPMTQTERNNLTSEQLWNGRLILNTSTERINRYDLASDSWFVVAEQSDSIMYYTETQRDSLSGTALFDGRLILNTTSDRINRYDEATGLWVPILEPEDIDHTEILATTGLPARVDAYGGSGGLGSSDFAARADHVHPPSTDPLTTLVYGSFVGDGTSGRLIPLPITPRQATVYYDNPSDISDGLVYTVTPEISVVVRYNDYNDPTKAVLCTTGGLLVKQSGTTNFHMNSNNTTYKYVAIG